MTTLYTPETASARQRQDEQAIRALTERYTDAVNQRDWAALRDCWSADATWDLGAPVNLVKTGVDAIVAEARHAVEAMDLFVQMTHAGVILRLDQDSARARWTLNEIGRIKADQRALLGGVDGMNILATYTDELVREADGRWRFARRTYRVALFDGHAPAGDVVTAAPASA